MRTSYDDIINMPHHVSSKHEPMAMENRAAQFAPFAALTGYNDAIDEAARTTTMPIEQTAEQLLELSHRLAYALSFVDKPIVTITYFKTDANKQGGEYVSIIGQIKKIEPCFNTLILNDNTQIQLNAISNIVGDIFADLDSLV